MDVLKNYIFYSICEKSYELFTESNYVTYVNFCLGLKTSIELENLDSKDSARIIEILDYLKQIYGFEYTESGEYVKSFFVEEKYKDFERNVRLVKEFFINSFN